MHSSMTNNDMVIKMKDHMNVIQDVIWPFSIYNVVWLLSIDIDIDIDTNTNTDMDMDTNTDT